MNTTKSTLQEWLKAELNKARKVAQTDYIIGKISALEDLEELLEETPSTKDSGEVEALKATRDTYYELNQRLSEDLRTANQKIAELEQLAANHPQPSAPVSAEENWIERYDKWYHQQREFKPTYMDLAIWVDRNVIQPMRAATLSRTDTVEPPL